MLQPLDEAGIELARDAAEVLLPGRRAEVRWTCVDGSRAVAAIAFDGDARPDLQVALRRTPRGGWKQVGAGQAGDWSPLERPLGVATAIVPVDPAAVAVRTSDGSGAEALAPAAHGHALVPLWDVPYEGPWEFPTVVAVLDADGVWTPASLA